LIAFKTSVIGVIPERALMSPSCSMVSFPSLLPFPLSRRMKVFSVSCPEFLAQLENFKNTGSTLHSDTVAEIAPFPREKGKILRKLYLSRKGIYNFSYLLILCFVGLISAFAFWTYSTYQPLSNYEIDRSVYHCRIGSHIEKPGKGGDGIVGVKTGDYQVAVSAP
jgi:hypothetical protein